MDEDIEGFTLLRIVIINVIVLLFGDWLTGIFVIRFAHSFLVRIIIEPSYINLIFLVNEENVINNPAKDQKTGNSGNQKCPWYYRS